MTTAEQELISFSNYARQRIKAGDRDLSIDELFDSWRLEHPSPAQYAADVAALQEAIRDHLAGDAGIPAGEHSDELRRQIIARQK